MSTYQGKTVLRWFAAAVLLVAIAIPMSSLLVAQPAQDDQALAVQTSDVRLAADDGEQMEGTSAVSALMSANVVGKAPLLSRSFRRPASAFVP